MYAFYQVLNEIYHQKYGFKHLAPTGPPYGESCRVQAPLAAFLGIWNGAKYAI